VPWNRLVLSLVNFAFVSSKALTKKKISMLLYNNRLHGRSVTSDVSKNKPINFVSCGPIGTQSVPFALVRPQQWISRVFFIKKNARRSNQSFNRDDRDEKGDLPKATERQPDYCNRRPRRPAELGDPYKTTGTDRFPFNPKWTVPRGGG